MRIVVLGGAGYQATVTVKDLVSSSVEEVIIADCNVDRATKLSGELSTDTTKVTAVYTDADKHESLVSAMKGADAVASGLGPYNKYGAKVIEAAIDAGVPFADINDDYDSTRACLPLDTAARKAGVTVLVGMGASPGMTNIMARYGADALDQADAVHSYWAASATEPSGIAVGLHSLHAQTGKIPTFRNGEMTDVEAFSEKELVEFLDPIGTQEVHQFGHPEPITIPMYLKGLKEVTLKGGMFPASMDRFYELLAYFDFSSKKPVRIGDHEVVPAEMTNELIHHASIFKTPEMKGPKEGFGTVVEVSGRKAGQDVRYRYSWNGRMHRLTGISLSIATQMLARGDMREPGVFAPEGCVDPAAFLSEWKKRGLMIFEQVTMGHEL